MTVKKNKTTLSINQYVVFTVSRLMVILSLKDKSLSPLPNKHHFQMPKLTQSGQVCPQILALH